MARLPLSRLSAPGWHPPARGSRIRSDGAVPRLDAARLPATRRSVSVERTFFVPVRTSKAGTVAVRTGRLRSGERVGLAFTSETSLTRTLGGAQQWIHLSGAALADMLAPLGVEHIRIDAHPAGE